MLLGGDLTWGGKHTIQYSDDVLYKCVPETLNFINQCYPNKLNKNKIIFQNYPNLLFFKFNLSSNHIDFVLKVFLECLLILFLSKFQILALLCTYYFFILYCISSYLFAYSESDYREPVVTQSLCELTSDSPQGPSHTVAVQADGMGTKSRSQTRLTTPLLLMLLPIFHPPE